MEFGIGGTAALVVGFPVLLFGMLSGLAWLEAWTLQPDERAAAVQRLLAQEEEVERLEQAVADLLAQVADDPRRAPQPDVRQARMEPSVPAGTGVS